jgi:16S rRNA (cytosine1402-N4)-methyltransferase
MMTDSKEQAGVPASLQHASVMVGETLDILQPQSGGIYVDATLGLGGHARAILQRLGHRGRLIGIDQDASSLEAAKKDLEGCADRCEFVHDPFSQVDKILKSLRIEKVDGILFDFGISSFQLDDAQRGFSFQREGPLDMRMDRQGKLTAYDLVNSLSEFEIAKILRDYGQERFYRRIAKNIVRTRALTPIRTTGQLKDIVSRSMPRGRSREKIHPATRTFQAFRMAVNAELAEIETALEKSIELLRPGGRMVAISFHSLEDRIVKQKFKLFSAMGLAEVLTKKPLRPTPEEEALNSRARSARLRGVKRL